MSEAKSFVGKVIVVTGAGAGVGRAVASFSRAWGEARPHLARPRRAGGAGRDLRARAPSGPPRAPRRQPLKRGLRRGGPLRARAWPHRRLGQRRDADRFLAGPRNRAGRIPPRDRGHLSRRRLWLDGGAETHASASARADHQHRLGARLSRHPLQSAYCGAKHAIRGFTASLRTELEHDARP